MFLTLMWRTNWVLYLAPLAWALWRRDARVLLLAAIFAAQSAYSVYAGGAARDWWGGSNRYVCLGMPMLLVLLACLLAQLRAGAFAARRSSSLAGVKGCYDKRSTISSP